MEKKIRILHLIESLGRGGAEKRLYNDLKYLDKDKFTNHVFYLFPDNTIEADINALGVKTGCLYAELNLRFLKALVRLLRFIQREKIDIIHTQLFSADILGRLMALFTRKPVLTTIQSSVYERKVNFLYSCKRHLIDKLSAKLCASYIIAVSEFVKTSVKKRLGIKDNKIRVIFNSIEDELGQIDYNLLDQYRKKFKVGPEEIILLTIGKLNPGKGHRYLIRALADLNNQKIKLLIAGSGGLKQELEDYARKLKVNDKVLFIGDIKNIKELIALCDIFIFPTLSEGMPFSLLEAMVQRKPVIASRIEPIEEVVEHQVNGMLFPPKDTKALAAAINLLTQDSHQARELGLHGRETVLERFYAKTAAEKLGRLYVSLFQGSGGGF